MTQRSPPPSSGNLLALCCGMIRSGSTLQYQIVSELVEQAGIGRRAGFLHPECVRGILDEADSTPGISVVKVHEILPEVDARIARGGVVLFHCYRDLRAVAVSIMDKWGTPFAEIIGPGGWLDTAVGASNYWLGMPGVCVSRYEDILLALPAEIAKWSAALGLSLDSGQIAAIAGQYSMSAQRERVQSITTWQPARPGMPDGYFDTNTLLHRDHIRDGSLEGWKEKLNPSELAQIESKFSAWLGAHGYPLLRDGWA